MDLAVDVARWEWRSTRSRKSRLRQGHQDFRRSLKSIRALRRGGLSALGAAPPRSAPCSRPMSWSMPSCRGPKEWSSRFHIIDCMRLDQWLTLEPRIAEHFEGQAGSTTARSCRLRHPTRATRLLRAAAIELPPAASGFWQETGKERADEESLQRQLMDFQLARLKAVPEKPVKYMKIYDADEAHQVRRQIQLVRGPFAG